MIQSNKTNQAIVEPLLKTILILANSGLEADSQESAGDILNLVTSQIADTSATDAEKTNYLRVCLNLLSRLNSVIPTASEVAVQLVKEIHSKVM